MKLIFGLLALASLVSGNPWSEENAQIIRNKLRFLWLSTNSESNAINTFDDFDTGNPVAKYSDFVYDPTNRLTTKDCDKCDDWVTGEKRKMDYSFTERKAIRLAFHDCVLYEDGTGGCDGCLNFDENINENMGLQHTAAVLEKLYTDVNFPQFSTVFQGSQPKNLEMSPKDLGMSRADLWAFTGLVALDEYLQFTKGYCEYFKYNLTCNTTLDCYDPLPNLYTKMFMTGRKDCQTSSNAGPNQGYLASQVEVFPHEGFNGEMTVKYFKSQFGMNGKESLALMGAHTVGKFNPINSHLDYAWVRAVESDRQEIFNNEYYKNLALRPSLIKDGKCIGQINGDPAPANIEPYANVFQKMWDPPSPWAESKKKPGKLSWRLNYKRGPACGFEDDEDMEENDEFFDREELNKLGEEHGFVSDFSKEGGKGSAGFQWCCDEIVNKKCNDNNNCPPECTITAQGRIRMTSNDIGYYLKWDIDNEGLPTGCKVFDEIKGGHTMENFGVKGPLGVVEKGDCPMQDILEKGTKGKPLWQRVEIYADNNGLWINDFAKSFLKMQSNGNKGVLETGPSQFWGFDCCFNTGIKLNTSSKIKVHNGVLNAVECQKLCAAEDRCKSFEFRGQKGACFLLENEPEVVSSSIRVDKDKQYVTGPRECDLSKCAAYQLGF